MPDIYPGVNRNVVFKVGLIGYGTQGKFHFENIWNTPPFQVDWVFDRDSDKVSALPDALRVSSIEDAVGRKVQIVVIATPPASHFQMAQLLLLAGKNVLLEKPTSVTYSETCRLVDLARRQGRFILTHFNRRWDRDFLAVKHALKKYDFGTVHEIESRVADGYALCESFPGRKAWKLEYPGGGILLDWAPHLFDQLFDLVGRITPKHIYCHCGRPNQLVDCRLEEQFTIQITYKHCLATLGASWNAGLPYQRWHISGTRAALIINRLGEGNGTVRFRKGETTSVEQIRQPVTPPATERLRVLVGQSLQNHNILSKEIRRMQMVSYAIDVARESYLAGNPLKWDLT